MVEVTIETPDGKTVELSDIHTIETVELHHFGEVFFVWDGEPDFEDSSYEVHEGTITHVVSED